MEDPDNIPKMLNYTYLRMVTWTVSQYKPVIHNYDNQYQTLFVFDHSITDVKNMKS